MKAYEAGNPSYFATPPVNLIYAYNASLKAITESSPSIEDRFRIHREASKRFKDAAKGLGLKEVPLRPEVAANGMTALYFPDGLGAADILPRLVKRGIVVAGGLGMPSIKDKYFRIGHMGISAVDTERGGYREGDFITQRGSRGSEGSEIDSYDTVIQVLYLKEMCTTIYK
ncbi:hypothetical protein E1B28_013868 [Marasmius oreades]|uniref:Uncharacterized protein n=1 Tax=Marasmius oreades TaxID=181124 RepID=A0A9P7UMT2_9AGAR|nr:uncharacterized protein E1B28_013868 [Marasmius oreades]KAG7085264.1 hypothetical protein E1B28_013868 [Marasmius oreades]